MKKQKLNPADCAGEIIRALPAGILMTTKAGDKVNSMVIGWGTVGVNWGKPVFIAFVRESRFTKSLVDENPEFTVNVPAGKPDPKVIAVCGSKSGRSLDKLAEAGLTPVDAEVISVPAIKEFPLTLECRVLYRQEQEEEALGEMILDRFYPQDGNGKRDLHTTYIAEIVDCYRIEE